MSRSAWDEHACMSPDGKWLYFTSDREGGQGGIDIWMAERQPDGEWGTPVNMGPGINTRWDERGPFMHADNQTLYFSSEGHNSMGGLDIFRTVRQADGTYSRPQNIGYPINTSEDDVYFVMSASGRRGYYSSSQEGGYGEKDIYMITFPQPDMQQLATQQHNAAPSLTLNVQPIPQNTVLILKGTVTDADNGQPVAATLRIVSNTRNEVISNQESNSATGKYLTTLPSGGNYAIFVEAPNYLFHSEHFDVIQGAESQEIIRDVKLKHIRRGQTIVLKNIFFDNDKYTLRPESQAELQELIQTLTENPALKISINGHTDSNAPDDYNQTLSENRARAVVEYLVQHGIAADRLQSKGYGETQPIDTNDTPEGRQNNRRTEFEILSF
jgi:outer membrane protein OmpA-like peptidoglycan-associated protein